MSENRLVLPSLLVLMVLGGCGDLTSSDSIPQPPACAAVVGPGIMIEVFDSETGEHASCGARALLEDGDFLEEIENAAGENCFDTTILMGAFGRIGTYDITVSKAGYRDWIRTDVEVTSGVCGVLPTRLQAHMEKQ
ncbi:MAG TPA: hypothetical protein VIU33_03155 [Nitrospiria bacterium]